VVLPRGPAHAGSIRLEAGSAVATFAAETGVTHEGRGVTRLNLRDDADGDPTVLRLSSLAFYVIRRGDRLGVRVKDPESPARKAFAGIDYFPIDPAWRFHARFEAYDPPRTFRVQTVLGTEEAYEVPGALAFEHHGEVHRLVAFLEPGETDLFLVFGDLTNRSETYGGGRYLYAPPPGGDGTVVLDFNKAYNPPCVFTPFATCALPLPQNRLPIRIEAGEKLYGGTAFPPVVPRG
jgi:uncharacterized protein (DUF1684 family)